MPCLSYSGLSSPNCPCSRPVISFLHSPKSPAPRLASPVPIPLLSQPLSHCSAILSSPCPVSLLCISSSPLFFHPFYPSHLTFIPPNSLSQFPFLSAQFRQHHSYLPGLRGIQGHGGDKPCALRPGSALPLQGRSCTSLHWSMLCEDASFRAQSKNSSKLLLNM